MKNKIYMISLMLINSISFGQTPQWIWAKSGGGNIEDLSTSIAVDANGNSYITGLCNSSNFNFGSITLGNPGNDNNFFIAKCDAAGNVLWAKLASGNSEGQGNSISLDGNGNVYVTGYFSTPTFSFGGTVITNVDSTGSSYDIFIVKYDSSGNALWAKSAGGTDFEIAYGITVDVAGNSYITGSIHGPSVTFDSITVYNSSNNYDAFIAKYDPSGNVLWAQVAGGIKGETCFGIANDIDGNVYLTGHFQSTAITFGGTTLYNTDTVGSSDIFIVKYDSSGNVKWARGAGGIGGEGISSIAMDSAGNAYITGSFSSPVLIFGSTALTIPVGFSYSDVFIAKYDSSGNVLWANSMGGNDGDESYSIIVDANGNSFITGRYASPDITIGTSTIINAGDYDIFMVSFNSSGVFQWMTSTGGVGTEYGLGLGLDGSENLYITGFFYEVPLTFGNTTLTNLNINDGSDIFVAKLTNVTGDSEKENLDDNLVIFPNPSKGQFNFTNSGLINELTIVNPAGQLIYHSKPADNKGSLLLLNDGIYFVTITTKNGIKTKKIIVQHADKQ